jgi:hypothetical protein
MSPLCDERTCPDPADCHCAWDDSDCFEVSGSGDAGNVILLDPRVDADTDSIVSCGPSGLAAFVPDDIADPAACRLTKASGNQTVPNNEETPLFWDSIRFNARNLFSFKDSGTPSATQGYNVVIPVDGIYMFHVQIRWTSGVATGTRKIALYRQDGASKIIEDERTTTQTDEFAQSFMHIGDFLAGDTVSVWAFQTSGVSRSIEKASPLTPEFAIVYRGPTLSPPSEN